MVLDVLIALQHVGFKVHEGARVSLGAQRRLGHHILRDVLEEGRHALVLATLCDDCSRSQFM